MRATVNWSRVGETLREHGRPWPARLSRPWLAVHLVSLVAVLGVLLFAARGQWFYYDEWDFLATRDEWDLFASHVGHFSFFPQLITTLIKSVVGLHSYWPFLLPTIAVHIVVVHLLWRLMMRVRVNAAVAVLAASVFGVLAPGAENTLWAFQLGFVTPLALGLGALLLAMHERITRRDLIGIGAMLTVSIGFSGTAIPMIVVTALVLMLRHGWRTALGPIGLPLVVYGAWYLVFNRGPHPWDAFRADTPAEFLVAVPRFVLHGIVDSVGDMLPLAELSPVLLVVLLGWVIVRVRRERGRATDVTLLLIVAAVFFAVLTALSRVGLGDGAASAGRYAYVYALLIAPAAALAVTGLARRSLGVLGLVAVLLVTLVAYNAGGLVKAGRDQATQERTVERAMSASLDVVGCDDASAALHPSTLIAPTLTMADICSFADRGQFTPVDYTPSDLLDVRINLLMTERAVQADAPPVEECELPDVGGVYPYDPATDLISLSAAAQLRVYAELDGAYTQYAAIYASEGVGRLVGLSGEDLHLRLGADSTQICVFPR